MAGSTSATAGTPQSNPINADIESPSLNISTTSVTTDAEADRSSPPASRADSGIPMPLASSKSAPASANVSPTPPSGTNVARSMSQRLADIDAARALYLATPPLPYRVPQLPMAAEAKSISEVEMNHREIMIEVKDYERRWTKLRQVKRSELLYRLSKTDPDVYLPYIAAHPTEIPGVEALLQPADRPLVFVGWKPDKEAALSKVPISQQEGKLRCIFPKATWGDWSWDQQSKGAPAPDVGPRDEVEPGVEEQMMPRRVTRRERLRSFVMGAVRLSEPADDAEPSDDGEEAVVEEQETPRRTSKRESFRSFVRARLHSTETSANAVYNQEAESEAQEPSVCRKVSKRGRVKAFVMERVQSSSMSGNEEQSSS